MKWLLANLDTLENRKAKWRVLLAFRDGNDVYVSEGIVNGKLVQKRGEGGFGFDPVFLPDGAEKTLAQDKPDSVNARAKAVENLVNRKFIAVENAIDNWQGGWQADH